MLLTKLELHRKNWRSKERVGVNCQFAEEICSRETFLQIGAAGM